MIAVDNLTKRYAGVTAVDGISFRVGAGEILGFLGPNGAGKTTTMRILTCFMPATSGAASVGGYDVFDQSLQVRRLVGYMPENVPLYTDMRVREYLDYRAKLKEVPRSKRRKAVDDALERCWITDVSTRVIGQLSKGYRQRVGLADTLVHDPKVLILDEPTIGLDPNQVRRVRELIRNLGEDHTVILSTHILPEVEMTCSRVIIIHNGRLVAEGTPGDLAAARDGGSFVRMEVRGPARQIEDTLRKVPGVAKVSCDEAAGSCRLIVTPKEGDPRTELARVVVNSGWDLLEMHQEGASLEDIFVQITTEDRGGKE